MIPDQMLRLAINRLTVLRAPEKRQLEEIVDTESFFCALTPRLLSQIVGRSIARMDYPGESLLRAAENDAADLRQRNAFFLAQTDARYPAPLREIYDAPYLLFVRGELPADGHSAVAIVGTRGPTAQAVVAAETIAADLVSSGVPVISGLARGIDVAAHIGALRGVPPGGLVPTGAVLASGVDLITPSGNRSVAAEILDRGGFIVSEYSPGVAPQKYHFPARNRIISGLARGVIVVQAPIKSGALITADYALDQGRDLFVHRAGLEGKTGAGSADLADDGAIIVDCAGDVLGEWGLAPHSGAPAEPVVVSGGAEPASSAAAAQERIAAIRRELGEVGA